MKQSTDINCLARHLHQGDIIAYPSESVYALGCDPKNKSAIRRLLTIKKRPENKGFILVGASFSDFESFVEPVSPKAMAQIELSWPGPVTWVFPRQPHVSSLLCGDFSSLAVRVSAFPLVRALCLAFGGPIISTSANINGYPPARDAQTTELIFGSAIDVLLPGSVGGLSKPTPIFDAITGDMIRQG